MQRYYFRLVCKDGRVYQVDQPWPGFDGKPDPNVAGTVWMIGYESEIVENFRGLSKTIRPERYYALMRAAHTPDGLPHGMKNSGMCPECKGKGCPSCPEETQIREILPGDVKDLSILLGFNDATERFGKMMRAQNQDLIPPDDDAELAEAINGLLDERFPKLRKICELDKIFARELLELIDVQAEEPDDDDDDDGDDDEPVAAAKPNGSTDAPRA
jgi:hypothetical protein